MRKLLLIFLFGIGMHFCYAQQSGTPAGTAMPQTQAWVNGTGTTGTLSLYFGSSQYFQIPTYKQFLDSLVNAIKYADTTSKIETRYHAAHTYQPLLTGLTFGTTGTDFNGSITGSTLALNIPDASGTARGLINLGNQTLGTAGTTKTFAGNVIINQLLSLASTFQSSTGGATSSNLYVLSSTVSNITTAKYLFGGTTGVYYRMLLNGNNSGNLTGANNYASSIWADHTVPVVTAITIPVASQLVVKNFTLSLAGTAAVTEKDGLYLEAQKGGVNNYSMHALGKVKIDQHALGVAGTDSLLVSNGGEVKTIPANYYAPAAGIAGYVPYTGATGDVNLGANSLTVPRIYGGVATTDTARISPYPTSTAKMLGSDKGFGFTTLGPFVAGINATIQISDLWLNQPTVKRSLFISSSQSNTTGTNIGGSILAATNISIPATNTGNITSHIAYNMNITAAAGATGTVTNFGGNQIFVSNNATGLTATNMFGQIITVANSGPNTNTVGLGIRGVFGTPTGKYSLYNDLALPSYTAANTLLGGLTDNGVDKLQITGGLLANGQAHYGAGHTLGALDFMYKQKADSLYAPKITYVAANDSTVIHNIASSGIAEAKNINITRNAIIGDTLVAQQIRLRSTINGNKNFAIGYNAGSTFASISNINTDAGANSDIPWGVQVTQTASAVTAPNKSLYIAGAAISARIGGSNTQNWAAVSGGLPILRGVSTYVVPSNGAVGTIERAAAYFGSMQASTMTLNQANLIDVTFPSTGTINYAVGARIARTNSGVNGTSIFLTNSDSELPPTGYWGLYNNVGYKNYLGTGATLINTTTDNGVDKLQVNGTIHAKGVKVDLNFPAPDYVFDAGYKLASLPEVKKYIDANHHLAEVPSAQQIAKDGIDLGEMNAKLLKKVEELTLYLINKDKEDQQRQQLITEQQQQINALKKQVESLATTINKN